MACISRSRAQPRLSTDANRSGACAPVAPGAVAAAWSRALLGSAFVVYLAGVLASVAGLRPLASRWTACALLALGVSLYALMSPGTRAALIAARGRAPAAPAPAQGVLEDHPSSPGLARAGALAWACGLAATLVVFALALALPIGAYDALGYRLPAIASWLDAGAVVWVPGDDPLRNGYPLGLEVIAAVCFRAFDSAAAVDAVSVPLVLGGALALASFAGELGLPRWAGRLAAGLFLLVPMQLLNAPSGYVDAAFAGVMVALLVAVARWVRAGEMAPSLAAEVGIAAALVTALKPHGFAFATLALAVGLWRRLRALEVGKAMQGFGRVLALACPGLFFAGRNAMVTGNPLYPLELRLGERVLLRGESSLDGILTPAFNVPRELAGLPSLLRPFWVWLQPHGPARSFDDRLAGFGYAFVAVGLPALAWAAWRSRAAPEARGLALVIGLTFACWLLQPLSFWPRFSSWVWGAAALAIAFTASELLRSGRHRGALALVWAALLLAVPEAVYALAHVKGLDRLGLAILGDDSITQLARVSGVDPEFVQRALVGKRDVCRTPWRLGTDDANLDGVVAQLSPRPRMHVVDDERWSALPAALRAHGCDQLIAIGDSPLLKQLPADASVRVEPALAFGPCHLISLSLPEVNP